MLNHLLTPYLYDDELRPYFCVPFTNNTHTFATDAKTFIRVPNYYIDEVPAYIPSNQKYLDTLASIIGTDNPIIKINSVDLAGLIQQIPNRNEYQNCEKCSGYGEIVCPCCDQITVCKECEGTGDSDVVIGKTLGPAIVRIQNVTFWAQYIARLMKTAQDLDATEIGYQELKGKLEGALFHLPHEVIVCVLRRRAESQSNVYTLQLKTP